jgi:hypothetical protein
MLMIICYDIFLNVSKNIPTNIQIELNGLRFGIFGMRGMGDIQTYG